MNSNKYIVLDKTDRHVQPMYGYFKTGFEAGLWADSKIKSGEYDVLNLEEVIEVQMNTKLKDALAECETYAKIGGLNEDMIADIAHDHKVNFEKLKKAVEDW